MVDGADPSVDWPDDFGTSWPIASSRASRSSRSLPGRCRTFRAEPDGIWHPKQANEGGWPWAPGWGASESGLLRWADRRIAAIVDAGIVPCIVGMWGYYAHVDGCERIRRHWREPRRALRGVPGRVLRRGEVNYPRGSRARRRRPGGTRRSGQGQRRVEDPSMRCAGRPVPEPGDRPPRLPGRWTEPSPTRPGSTSTWCRRPTGAITPRPPTSRGDRAGDGAERTGPAWGSRGHRAGRGGGRQTPPMPVVNAEPCYEGIMGGNWQDVQRFLFWPGCCRPGRLHLRRQRHLAADTRQ